MLSGDYQEVRDVCYQVITRRAEGSSTCVKCMGLKLQKGSSTCVKYIEWEVVQERVYELTICLVDDR
jgi:hypothetical protein